MPCDRSGLNLHKQGGYLPESFALARAYRVPFVSRNPLERVLAQGPKRSGITYTAGHSSYTIKSPPCTGRREGGNSGLWTNCIGGTRMTLTPADWRRKARVSSCQDLTGLTDPSGLRRAQADVIEACLKEENDV